MGLRRAAAVMVCTALAFTAPVHPAFAADQRTPDRNGEIAAYAHYAFGTAPTNAQWQKWRVLVDGGCTAGLPALADKLFTSKKYDKRNADRKLGSRVTRLYLALQDRSPSKKKVRKGKSYVRKNTWPALVGKVSDSSRYTDRVAEICAGDTMIAYQHRNAWVYVNWDWSGEDFGQNLDQELMIAKRAPKSYWANVWSWTDASYGGYMGLQTDGNRLDGTNGDTAIFSLWNAHEADGPSCDGFAGEGEGLSCRAAYPIETDHWYRLRVWKLDSYEDGDDTFQWWGAWVLDETADTETYLGQISVPVSHATMRAQINFSEYYGDPLPHTYDVPRSVVWWAAPAADYNTDEDSYLYTSTFSSAPVGPGTTGKGSDEEVDVTTPLGDTKAVRVRMGG